MTSGPSIEGAPPNAQPLPFAPPTTSGGITLRFFEALGAGDGAAGTYVAACVATSIPGWVEDARPIVTAKAVAFTGQLASRAAGQAATLRGTGEGPFEVVGAAPSARGGEASLGIARTFVGFEGTNLVTCGVVCVGAPRSEEGPPGALFCEAAVRGGHLVGASPPPPPGFVGSALALVVHRPREVLGGAIVVAMAAAVFAVVTRPRPRTRPPKPRSTGH